MGKKDKKWRGAHKHYASGFPQRFVPPNEPPPYLLQHPQRNHAAEPGPKVQSEPETMESLLDKASRASRGIVPHATQEKPNPRPNLEVSSSPALSSTNAPKSLPSSKPPVVVIPDTDSEGEEKVARASPAESPQLQGSGKMQKRDQELQDDDDALLLPKPKDSEDESEVLTETLRQAAMGKALRGEKRKKVDGQQAVKESSASGSKKCMKEDKKKKKKKNDKKKG